MDLWEGASEGVKGVSVIRFVYLFRAQPLDIRCINISYLQNDQIAAY